MAADPAVRVSVPVSWAEVAGALLMELLGPFQEWEEGGAVHLLFYPFRFGAGFVEDDAIRAALPVDASLQEHLVVERLLVPAGWEEGWKQHFKPTIIGRVCLRPPWEEAPAAGVTATATSSRGDLLDVVLTPGLAFGTGLHATTRGILTLLQDLPAGGPLFDAGTGSGVLSIAAGRLGYHPIRAIDDDPLAVDAARSNAASNDVGLDVRLLDVSGAPCSWVEGATVLANINLEPVLALLQRVADCGATVRRLLVSGILAGEQEARLVEAAAAEGLTLARVLYEEDWASFDLRPSTRGRRLSTTTDPASAG
jgi:ribosomal protein L11 methyltransferase